MCSSNAISCSSPPLSDQYAAADAPRFFADLKAATGPSDKHAVCFCAQLVLAFPSTSLCCIILCWSSTHAVHCSERTTFWYLLVNLVRCLFKLDLIIFWRIH